jgi:hypothetical protein
MRRRSRLSCPAVCLLVLVAGCGSRLPVAPVLPLDGTWTGSIAHSRAGDGTVVLRMTQTGVAATGTWTASFAGGASGMTGSIGGTLSGPSAALFLTPADPLVCGGGLTLSGTFALTATVTGDRLSGSFVAFTCDGADTGDLDVTRTD